MKAPAEQVPITETTKQMVSTQLVTFVTGVFDKRVFKAG